MSLLQQLLHAIGSGISRLLEPALVPLDELDDFLRMEMTTLFVPSSWQPVLITAGWAIVLALLFRMLEGWKRVVLVLVTAAVLAKIYGVLPLPSR